MVERRFEVHGGIRFTLGDEPWSGKELAGGSCKLVTAKNMPCSALQLLG